MLHFRNLSSFNAAMPAMGLVLIVNLMKMTPQSCFNAAMPAMGLVLSEE